MSTTRESSTETADRYTFGYSTELSNHESSLCTAKRLRQRLQRQQSGQSGRRYTGHHRHFTVFTDYLVGFRESSAGSSVVGTPTESGRCFTFTAAQRILTRTEERKPSVNQNLTEMLLDAIHLDDVQLVDRLLLTHSTNKILSSSPSIGSTNTFTDLAQRRHGAGTTHRRSNASSASTYSGGRSNCALANTLHMAVAHKQRSIVELLLKSGYDPNQVAACQCKGACITSGNIPLSSVIPRNHSSQPEICGICSHLRIISIIDHSPLAVAIQAQSPEMITLLVNYGADVNATDEDGNSPLMLAVRESPLSWATLHMLILFGARIRQKNTRGICPLDLAPEIDKLQETCVENMFQAACAPPVTAASLGVPGANEDSLSVSQPSTHERVVRTAALIHPSKHSKKVHADAESLLFLPSNFGTPLSPRNSTAPSVSTVSMLDSLSVKEKDPRRKSFVSLQLHRRTKTPKESPLFDNVSWDQAWEMLQKMACNPECIELIMRFILKSCSQLDDSVLSEKDAMDSNLGGLLHQIILTAIGEYQQSTPTYQRANKKKLIGTLASLVNFCYLCLQKMVETISFYEFKIKMIKSSFIKSEIKYLGQIISKEGRRPDPKKIEAVVKMPSLTDLIKSFFSFLQFVLLFVATGSKSEPIASFGELQDVLGEEDGADVECQFTCLQRTNHDFFYFRSLFVDETGESIGMAKFGSLLVFNFEDQTIYHFTHPTLNNSVGEEPNHAIASIVEESRRRQTCESTTGPSLILHNFYRRQGLSAENTQKAKMVDLVTAFATIQPATIIACLHNAITMHNREAGARSVCSPAHRWRQCHFHCTQILVARLLLFCCSYKEFRQRLSEKAQLKTLIQLLDPTLDPQLLCLLLQTIGIIALDPSLHSRLIEMQVDDSLIQMLLPADDWYYTNHSTKFGHFVKHHAARILIYIGLGDRVGNRVNIFQNYESIANSLDPRRTNSNSPNEDQYIVSTLSTPHITQEFSKTAMSVEGVLLKVLQELSKNSLATSEPITEETPSAVSSPAVLVKTLISSTGCIIEECEEKVLVI
uniref:ANK_REP_REGION domain-containing protein n=1 Tax=Ditylenchus dipsaci TaxID=166011 RepID=A0A915DP43_9BILA